ncbi:hypothetical protein [Sporosarcina sp. P18a]|uniref:phage tail assembly chaperone n=1 Tax=Sporosarcina sp. P18a TaxID=2048259 RepID=UPI0013041D5C|nr:hypothetical protein [Sporosarcina sp. P18a]
MTENVAKFEEYKEVEVQEEPKKKKSALEALLGTTTDIQKTISLERFKDVDFVIKAITAEEIQEIREECTHSRPGKGGKMEDHVNDQEVGELVVAKACIEPDFSNPELMAHYGAESPGDCTQKALLAGEVMKLTIEIFDLSGFEDEPTEEIKNG